jgi:hypothetical protein
MLWIFSFGPTLAKTNPSATMLSFLSIANLHFLPYIKIYNNETIKKTLHNTKAKLKPKWLSVNILVVSNTFPALGAGRDTCVRVFGFPSLLA